MSTSVTRDLNSHQMRRCDIIQLMERLSNALYVRLISLASALALFCICLYLVICLYFCAFLGI